jgi:hypothetical protein
MPNVDAATAAWGSLVLYSARFSKLVQDPNAEAAARAALVRDAGGSTFAPGFGASGPTTLILQEKVSREDVSRLVAGAPDANRPDPARWFFEVLAINRYRSSALRAWTEPLAVAARYLRDGDGSFAPLGPDAASLGRSGTTALVATTLSAVRRFASTRIR